MDYLSLDLEMPGLSPLLWQRLQYTLPRCGVFNSDGAVRGVFLDMRLNLWRAGLPEETNTAARVSAVINYLYERFNKAGDNGLYLLVRVLCDSVDPNDALHSQLEGLAVELEKLQTAAQLVAQQKVSARQARDLAVLAAEHLDQLHAALTAAQSWVDIAPDDKAARALLADLIGREEARCRMQEEAERQAQEEADRKAREEADRKAKAEADRKAKEEADRKAKAEAARKAQAAERLKPALVNLANLPVWLWGVIAVAGLLGVWGLGALFSAPPLKPVSTVTPTAGDTWMRRVDDMVMVYVPAGEFQMGSEDSDAYDNEKPVHTVRLDAFWIDQTEVLNAQYEKCVQAGKCVVSAFKDNATYNGATQPVVGVDWHNAAAYCAWAGGQLPTEAQWEYAARGPEGLKYPWGNQAPTCELANYTGCVGKTAPVGSYSDGASWVGALDMAGNVWEWVADWYGGYPAGQQTNPTGPISGSSKVVRGGSWRYDGWDVRTAVRLRYTPAYRFGGFLGFRCIAVRQD